MWPGSPWQHLKLSGNRPAWGARQCLEVYWLAVSLCPGTTYQDLRSPLQGASCACCLPDGLQAIELQALRAL